MRRRSHEAKMRKCQEGNTRRIGCRCHTENHSLVTAPMPSRKFLHEQQESRLKEVGSTAIFLSRLEDTTVRYLPAIFKGLALAIMTWWLWFLAFHYIVFAPGYDPPWFTIIVHAINTIFHEAGHFFFKIFGRTMYILGGSVFQVLFPLGVTVFVWFKWREYAVYPLYWTGWNLIDVAIYIYDAPFLLLPLLGRSKSGHDWRNLLTHWNALDSAVPIALVVHWAGVFTSLAAIVWGVYYTVKSFREAGPEYSLRETPDPFRPPEEEYEEQYL